MPDSFRPIRALATDLGLDPQHVRALGEDMAKISPEALSDAGRGQGRLILVSAITPTPAGEGKTTTSIGLAQGLTRLGERACVALREPSLGPVFGRKGGGTGTGRSQLIPSSRINLHFTGDFHAIAAAHNLLAAVVDNHLYFGGTPRLDPRRVTWPRVVDMNDRALRSIVLGLGGPSHGVPREGKFEITAASEVMAALCLANGVDDLRARLERLIVGFDSDMTPVTAGTLGAQGAMLALLHDAVWPNLVQTTEGVAAFVHGGPFANIAHGCNSVLATRLGLHTSDWVITEAGFGFDLGAEKFFDIKCRTAGFDTRAVVLVATVRALKYHGDATISDLTRPDPGAVAAGLPNLDKHVGNIRAFGEAPVVALNRFPSDAAEEIDVVAQHCRHAGLPFAVSDHVAKGGDGALELARTVMDHAERIEIPFRPLYELEAPVTAKIERVAKTMYGARGVVYARKAEKELALVERLGLTRLPVCLAKTHQSLSDDPARRGRPEDFDITVRDIQIQAGAGFLVVLTGDILRMPGLPRTPRALDIDLKGLEVIGVD